MALSYGVIFCVADRRVERLVNEFRGLEVCYLGCRVNDSCQLRGGKEIVMNYLACLFVGECGGSGFVCDPCAGKF